MHSDRIYSPTSYTHRSSSSAPRPVRKSPAIPLTSTSSTTSSFFKGRDGIYRPQSLLSLATETTDYSFSASSLPKSTVGNTRLNDFRAKHRTDSGYSSPKLSRTNYESSFQSNFNDNLRHLRTASGYGSSSYVPSYSTTSYRFTKAYYAPKMRERPLLSNLKARFGSGRDLSSSNTPTSSLRNKSSTSTAPSSHHSSTTSLTRHHDSVSSTGSNGNSVNSPVSSVNQQTPGPRLERNKFMIKFREHNQDQTAEKRRESIRWDIPRPCRFSKSDLKVDATIAEDEDDSEPIELLKPESPELVNDSITQQDETHVDENNNTLSRWDGQLELDKADNFVTKIEAKIEKIIEPEPILQPEIVDLVPVIKSEPIDLKVTKPKKALKKIKKKRDSDSDSLSVSDSSSLRSREASPTAKHAESAETKLIPPELKLQDNEQREASPRLEVNIVLPQCNDTKQRELSPVETVKVVLKKPKSDDLKKDLKSKEAKDKLKINKIEVRSKSRETSPEKKIKPINKTKSENKDLQTEKGLKDVSNIVNKKVPKQLKSVPKPEPKMLKESIEALKTNIFSSIRTNVDTSQVVIGKAIVYKKKKPISKEKKKSDEPKKLKKKKLTKELNIEKANEVTVNDVPTSPISPKSPKSPKIPDNLPSPKKLKVSTKSKRRISFENDIKLPNDVLPSGNKINEPIVKNESAPTKNQANDVSTTTQQSKPIQIDIKPVVPKVLTEPKRLRFREYCLEDFDLIAVLGRGSFGKVVLAELRDYDAFFAIKALKKKTVIEDDDIESIMIERKVLAYGSNYPFICKLFCTFQNETHLFFAMEWCGGGDMMFHVQKEGKFDEPKARFYACEILCSLNFLHSRGIIYRDLKLDNIMINHTGNISLVDFGMCVGKMYREDLLPSNFCGTPEYMAPEIIKGVKYNHSVDFWAFGIVIYEMLVGCAPFNGGDEDELLWNVCNRDVHYPNHLGPEVKDLIVLLLRRDPKTRLGMSTCREGKPQQQAWFAGVDWVKVEQCSIPPPFIPQMSHQADTSYFDQYFTKETPVISSGPPEDPISESDQELFKGFNFTNHHMTD